MSFEMIFVSIMVLAMLGGLLFEVARPDMVVFSVLTIFLITGVLTPEEALKGFSNEGMLTVALLFIVAAPLQKSGIINDMVKRWPSENGKPRKSMLQFFGPISAFSGFLNNTPIVVAFTPVIRKWCQDRNVSPSKFLIPLSYATILGGTITLMGTSTNLVVHGLLLDRGMSGFSFFQLGIVGIPITIIGLIYLFTVGYKLLPDHKGFEQQVKEHYREYIAEMSVDPNFAFINHTVKEAGLRQLKGLYLIEIIRQDERISPVKATTVIQSGDRLVFTGLISTIADLQKIKGLKLQTGGKFSLDDLKNGNTQLVEAVVSHQSYLVNKSIKQAKFRSLYDAGVIAVHRNNERIRSKIGDIILRPGDALLVLGGSDFVEKYRQNNDFYVLSALEAPELKEDKKKGWITLGLLLVAILLVTSSLLSMFKAMSLLVIILLATRILTPQDAKQSIQFHVLLLIASAFGIGEAVEKSGLAQWVADSVLSFGRPLGLLVILFLLYVFTNLFTELLTNSAAAVLMFPIGMELAGQLQVEPMGMAVIIAIAASASFITPIGYQTNLIVYGPGGYKFTDYVKVGTPLSLLVMITTVLIVHTIWF
ncbi:SLC13 family permease [Sediminibacillus massiliensis]|uniref:SLC13 family permease n=1 Tax=Sediminibacillus massiliensis TaxID=1926277 RepID=UPI000988415A|nr:SLC13 family permease [Sediminibacillus massiliensis]